MTFDEAIQMEQSALVAYLVDDMRVGGNEVKALQAAALDRAKAGGLSSEHRERWIAASEQAGNEIIKEAKEMKRASRMKQAGIRGVISAKQ